MVDKKVFKSITARPDLPSVLMASKLVVDCHTHLYLPRLVSLLRNRSNLPKIITRIRDGQKEERLVILADEPSGGRPVGPSYVERNEKLKFMKKHDIDISIVR